MSYLYPPRPAPKNPELAKLQQAVADAVERFGFPDISYAIAQALREPAFEECMGHDLRPLSGVTDGF